MVNLFAWASIGENGKPVGGKKRVTKAEKKLVSN